MTKDDVFQVIKKNILEVIPTISSEKITLDKYLKDLGANSVDRAEIVVEQSINKSYLSATSVGPEGR